MIDLEVFNKLLGLDITTNTKQRKYVRARQGVWTMLNCALWSYAEIARVFNCSRPTVMEGCDSFERDLKEEKDNISKQYWELLEPLIDEYAR